MSRIHDALKKAEAERGEAGTADGVRAHAALENPGTPGGELPAPPASLRTEPAMNSQPALREEELRLPYGVSRSASLSKVAERERDGPNPSAIRVPHKSLVCDATLLEQCARFDWTLNPNTMLSSDQSRYRIEAEEFRTLRSSLDLVRKQQALKTLLITSPLPKEGKTFIAVNLSQAIVWQHEQRVLLIDGDLRQSRVHTCFGKMSQEPGLADYLTGGVDPISLIRRGAENNFFVLPAGRSVPNALELIGNGRLKPLIEWLAPAFDWIIIDSPPCVPVSDARLIGECCDGILFIVRAGGTPSDLAKRSAGEIRGKRYLGVVLNAVDPGSIASSYYYAGTKNGSNRK